MLTLHLSAKVSVAGTGARGDSDSTSDFKRSKMSDSSLSILTEFINESSLKTVKNRITRFSN
jgi:hypothetical protein